MPCHPFQAKNSSGFICSRSIPRQQQCSVNGCTLPAVALCDYRDMGSVYETDDYGRKIGKRMVPSIFMCSRPLCMKHAYHAGPDEDYCPEHSSEFQIMRSRKAERLHIQRCKECGIEYDKNGQ